MHRIAAPALIAAMMAGAGPLHAQQPWLTADARVVHDDQPRTALHIDTEVGRFLGPDITLALGIGSSRITATTTGNAFDDATAYAGVAGTLSLPAARLGVRGGVRAMAGLPDAAADAAAVLGYGIASFNAGAGVSLRLRAERDRYTWTVASLDTAVFVNTLELALDRAGAPGWAGEAVGRLETYGDGNTVRTAFVWSLAPLSRSMTHSLRAGYAGAWQDSDYTRWVSRGAGSPLAREGQYNPYYTPHRVLAHSVIADAAVAFGSAWLRLDGSLGVHAREDAPLILPPALPATPGRRPVGFERRSFAPYRAGASLVVPAGSRTSMTVAGEYSRLAYYRVGTVRLGFARAL
jgi:hypothetical protein